MKHKPIRVDLKRASLNRAGLNRKQRRALERNKKRLVEIKGGAKVSVRGYRVVKQDTGEVVREIGVVNDN